MLAKRRVLGHRVSGSDPVRRRVLLRRWHCVAQGVPCQHQQRTRVCNPDALRVQRGLLRGARECRQALLCQVLLPVEFFDYESVPCQHGQHEHGRVLHCQRRVLLPGGWLSGGGVHSGAVLPARVQRERALRCWVLLRHLDHSDSLPCLQHVPPRGGSRGSVRVFGWVLLPHPRAGCRRVLRGGLLPWQHHGSCQVRRGVLLLSGHDDADALPALDVVERDWGYELYELRPEQGDWDVPVRVRGDEPWHGGGVHERDLSALLFLVSIWIGLCGIVPGRALAGIKRALVEKIYIVIHT